VFDKFFDFSSEKLFFSQNIRWQIKIFCFLEVLKFPFFYRFTKMTETQQPGPALALPLEDIFTRMLTLGFTRRKVKMITRDTEFQSLQYRNYQIVKLKEIYQKFTSFEIPHRTLADIFEVKVQVVDHALRT
jgi:hypothetical protein